MLVDGALQLLANKVLNCAGMARDHPEGLLLRIIVGAFQALLGLNMFLRCLS